MHYAVVGKFDTLLSFFFFFLSCTFAKIHRISRRSSTFKHSPPCSKTPSVHFVHVGMKEVIGEIDCDLEGRFEELRTGETNLGNLITDIMKRATRADVALLNSGTMRSDTIHEAGEFKMKVC